MFRDVFALVAIMDLRRKIIVNYLKKLNHIIGNWDSKITQGGNFLLSCLGVSSHLSAHIDWDANDHRRDGNAGYEGDAHGRAHQCAELPEDLLLSAPGLLPPEGAAWRTETIGGREEMGRQCVYHGYHDY